MTSKRSPPLLAINDPLADRPIREAEPIGPRIYFALVEIDHRPQVFIFLQILANAVLPPAHIFFRPGISQFGNDDRLAEFQRSLVVMKCSR